MAASAGSQHQTCCCLGPAALLMEGWPVPRTTRLAGTRLLSFRLLGFGAICTSGVICFAGSSSEIRTGWTAGGGVEWLLDQHWSTKIEYQFVDLGTETVRITALVPFAETTPASFNAAFHDRFNVVPAWLELSLLMRRGHGRTGLLMIRFHFRF